MTEVRNMHYPIQILKTEIDNVKARAINDFMYIDKDSPVRTWINQLEEAIRILEKEFNK